MPINYESDNPDTEKVLRELETMIISHGGQLSSDASVIISNGDLRVTSAKPATLNEKLMDVPEACMPAAEKFHLGIENDMIIIRGHEKNIPDSHLRSFEKMIELYNLCDKIRFQKQTNPWFALDDCPGLLDMLLAARIGNSKYENFQKLRQAGNHEQLLWEGLLGSRWYYLNSKRYGKAVRVLFPFIELLNHHSAAYAYHSSEGAGGEQSVWVHNCQPVHGSNECFVSYNLLDPLDTLLSYGYVDFTSEILRSVPAELTLSYGVRIRIAGRPGMPFKREELPARLTDLRVFLPRVLSHDQQCTTISHLFVPGPTAPDVLRRALKELFHNIRPTMEDTKIRDLVLESESLILQENINYYDSLAGKILELRKSGVENDFLDLLDQMVVHQKSWLKSYQLRTNDMTGQ